MLWSILSRLIFQEFFVEGPSEVYFRVKSCHLLFVLYKFFLADPVDIFVDMLQFFEFVFQILEGNGLVLKTVL